MKKWKYSEGSFIVLAIIVLGFVMQIIFKGEIIRPAQYPWTMLIGIVFTIGLAVIYFSFRKRRIIKWLCSVYAALPAILGFTGLVIIMGLTKQSQSNEREIIEILGLNNMIKSWPFILINLYLIVILGLVTFNRLKVFNIRNIGFFLNHFGLYLVLVSTTLASSDIQRISMNCYENQTEWIGTDDKGNKHELPFAIKLIDFEIDEFMPKVAIVNNKNGQLAESKGKPLVEVLDSQLIKIGNYAITTEKFIAYSGKLGEKYYPVNEPGASPSAYIKIRNNKNNSDIKGWLSSGSYSMQPEALKIDDNYSLVMLPAEARKFSSKINILTKSGKNINTIIEVNKPFSIDGWKIYQLSYNKDLGRWSDLSVLEFVRDPWLPAVYSGVFLMMVGAGFIFFYGKPKEGGTKDVA